MFAGALMSVSLSNFPPNNSRMVWWKLVRVSFEMIGCGMARLQDNDMN